MRVQAVPDEVDLGCREEILSWVHEAGNPYFDWLFGGADEAERVIRSRILSGESEVSVRNAALLIDDSGDMVGGFVALTGEELAESRMADAVAYVRAVGASRRAELIRRMQLSRGLFAAVEHDEFYLSKLGVRSTARGRGYGRLLVQEFLRVGTAWGLRHFVLDVSEQNRTASRLYESMGFRVAARSRVAEEGISYLSMRLALSAADSGRRV